MPESHAARGTRRGRHALGDLGSEVRAARLNAGLTLAEASAGAGISPAELSRIERDLAPWLDVVTAYTVCSVVGLDLSIRTFPGSNPLRDAGHLALQRAFLVRLGPGLVFRAEVPVGDPRDLRAWDGTIAEGSELAAVEFESRFVDAQASIRRYHLKRRDSGVDRVLLVVCDTSANRTAVGAAREVLRADYPLEPVEVLRFVTAGKVPPAGGILFLRPLREPSAPRSRPAEAGTNPRATPHAASRSADSGRNGVSRAATTSVLRERR